MIADRDFSDRYWELQVCGEVENLELQIISEGNVPGIGGSSVMRRNLLGWKCCWDMMELQEDLKQRKLLNELDDMVISNGVNGHLDTF